MKRKEIWKKVLYELCCSCYSVPSPSSSVSFVNLTSTPFMATMDSSNSPVKVFSRSKWNVKTWLNTVKCLSLGSWKNGFSLSSTPSGMSALNLSTSGRKTVKGLSQSASVSASEIEKVKKSSEFKMTHQALYSFVACFCCGQLWF